MKTTQRNKEKKQIVKTSTTTTTDDDVKKQIIKPTFKSYVLACRPWSLTVAVSSIAIGTTVAFKEVEQFDSINFAITMVGAIAVQCLSNLMNSYWDHVNSVDQKENAADRTMFDYGLSRKNIVRMIGGSLLICVIALIALMIRINDVNTIVGELIPLCFCGFLLSALYTARPFALKYTALGDITMFVGFGPLLTWGGFIAQTNYLALSPVYYCIPTAFLVTAIVHVNNTRDTKSDKQSGVKTIANIIGFKASFYLMIIYYTCAYAMITYMSIDQESQMMLLPYILLPKVFTLLKKFYQQQWDGLDAEAAFLSFFFSGLHTIGILLSDYYIYY